MGLRLSVRRSAWQQSVATYAAQMPGLIPVVKGNGYGFGRALLMPHAAALSSRIAVGTVYEAHDVPSDRTAVVLTPHMQAMPASLPVGAVLTVGSVAHVTALRTHGWTGSVVVKLRSSMHRYGATPADHDSLLDAIGSAQCVAVSYALHFPLVGTSNSHAREVDDWVPLLDSTLPIAVSHLDVGSYHRLREAMPDRVFEIRSGTSLWHGDKSSLHLSADVLDVHAVAANDVVGYRGAAVPANGHVVLVGAGSSHGVRAFDDGRSPFHFSRRRLVLLEPPHMHTSMVFVAHDQPCPEVGDRVDVQRPLTQSDVDEVEWIDD